MSATVKDVMTTRVAAVRKDAPYKAIATLLTQYRVSAFPVLDDDGIVIGVVSEAAWPGHPLTGLPGSRPWSR